MEDLKRQLKTIAECLPPSPFKDTVVKVTSAAIEEIDQLRSDSMTVQEMTTLVMEGSGAIAKLSAHPSVAALCMRLRKAEQAERTAAQVKWIPIKSQLPPLDFWVLLTNGRWRGVGKASSQYDDEVERWQDETREFIVPPPTHWMLLPDPPESHCICDPDKNIVCAFHDGADI